MAVRTLAVDELREVRDDGAWIVHVISGVETEVLPRVWSARSVIGVDSGVEKARFTAPQPVPACPAHDPCKATSLQSVEGPT